MKFMSNFKGNDLYKEALEDQNNPFHGIAKQCHTINSEIDQKIKSNFSAGTHVFLFGHSIESNVFNVEKYVLNVLERFSGLQLFLKD